MIKDWTLEEHSALRAGVPTRGLATPFRQETVRELAIRALAIAEDGLKRRARLDSFGRDESIFLQTLNNIAQSGVTPAEDMLADFHGRWAGNVDEAFRDYCY
jgi:glutamate--cysteine ligase